MTLTPPPRQAFGKQWRSLLEDPDTVARQYPVLAEMIGHPASRRRVLQVMAASIALGGLAGCDNGEADGKLIPAVIAAPGIVPGRANTYATANVVGGDAMGITVAHQMGRPLKVDGNPLHPASLGGSDAFAQAMILDFYDPDRAAGIITQGQPSDWPSLQRAMASERERLARSHGEGLRILTGSVVSPTTGRAIDALAAAYPAMRWHQWEAASRDNVSNGTALAYGRRLDVVPHVERASVILGLDSDLLSGAPGHVRHARDFAAHRNPTRGPMSRVYAAERTPTLLGTAADHRFIIGGAEMPALVAWLAAAVLRGEQPGSAPAWFAPLVADLKAVRGHVLIHAGPDLPVEAQALVLAMNEALGGRGRTFDVIEPVAYRAVDFGADLRALTDDMAAGRVETLLVLDTNPVFSAPGFAEALSRVRLSVASGPSLDETGNAATWYVPGAHAFEAWSDARAYDGTATIMQPQAMPLFDGMSAVGALSMLRSGFEGVPQDSLAAVRASWTSLARGDAWVQALADGVVQNSARRPAQVAIRAQAGRSVIPSVVSGEALVTVALVTRPDPGLFDGRFANNPWLQELPRPLTKVVWDNPLLLAPGLAHRLSLRQGEEVEVTVGAASARLPVWIAPGQAEDVVVALYGFGRRVVGAVGAGTGVDVYPLRYASGPVTLRGTGRVLKVATTDHHDVLDTGDTSDIVRHATLADFMRDPALLQDGVGSPLLYRNPPSGPVAWGMSIDLNSCIGCNACVVACTAENNVPVVGKTAVLHQREMHWLRIDRYFEGPAEKPEAYFQPMLCMHCEEAPCEVVCPFGATVHDQEGLNVMVYNRCGGTRFCSNNCPYKVRRFNYGPYAAEEARPVESRNSDVTVRSRGVMEKCTFCVQKIAATRIAHDISGVAEEAVTACQAACPTQAFSFGNLNEPDSEVVRRKHSPLNYVLLPDQNTRPRVTYEGRIRNLNPAIPA
jgi:Fe-S-cluster-containing dehydrogenase component